MIGFMLMAVNKREQQILTMAFEQLHIEITQSDPSYSNFVKISQYQPDVIIMEIPRLYTDQIHFANLIRKNKKTKKIPVIGYGDKIDEMQSRSLTKSGIRNYLTRPLKFSVLMEIVEKYLKIINKSVDKGGADTKSEKEEDIVLILDKNTLPTKKIELMVKHVHNLMAFPFTIAKVLLLTDSKSSGANDLAKVIEADPVITTSLLKVSNSVFFASLNRRISSIKDAIVRIGFRETKKIVMTMSVMKLVGNEDKNFGFNRMDFWVHSLATAIISERIAKRIGKINTDEAFLAGLLHDFGVLLFDEFFPTIFKKLLEETTTNGCRFIDSEKKILSITRNDLIKELFETWKIPESITTAVSDHYSVQSGDTGDNAKSAILTLCTYMGNILAKTFCLGAVCDQYVSPLDDSLFKLAKMPTGVSEDFYDGIINELKKYRDFLSIKDDTEEVVKEKKKIGVFSIVNSLFIPVEEYFKIQGYEVTRIPESASYTEFDQKFDAIFIWADSKASLKTIKPLTGIIQHVEKEGDAGGTPPMVPVCTCIPHDSPLANEDTKNLSLMYNEFDLRQLDVNLHKILTNETVVLQQRAEVPDTKADSGDTQEADHESDAE